MDGERLIGAMKAHFKARIDGGERQYWENWIGKISKRLSDREIEGYLIAMANEWVARREMGSPSLTQVREFFARAMGEERTECKMCGGSGRYVVMVVDGQPVRRKHLVVRPGGEIEERWATCYCKGGKLRGADFGWPAGTDFEQARWRSMCHGLWEESVGRPAGNWRAAHSASLAEDLRRSTHIPTRDELSTWLEVVRPNAAG